MLLGLLVYELVNTSKPRQRRHKVNMKLTNKEIEEGLKEAVRIIREAAGFPNYGWVVNRHDYTKWMKLEGKSREQVNKELRRAHIKPITHREWIKFPKPID